MADTFKAFIVDRTDHQAVFGIRDITKDDLPEREVIIRVDYSSVNYKDGLAITGKGPILKTFPIVPGVDYAGVVESSESSELKPGQRVLYQRYGGTAYKLDGREFVLVREKDILAVIEE